MIFAICYGRLRALKPISATGGSTKTVLSTFILFAAIHVFGKMWGYRLPIVHNNFTNHGRYFPNGLLSFVAMQNLS